MNDWKKEAVQARIDATWAFCKYAEDYPEEVPRLRRSPKAVRRLMATLGHFYLEEDPKRPQDVAGIPEDAEFRVFEFDPPDERDDLITIVLPPSRKAEGDKRRRDATEVWRCSYPPWLA